jgi:hypothetical protein
MANHAKQVVASCSLSINPNGHPSGQCSVDLQAKVCVRRVDQASMTVPTNAISIKRVALTGAAGQIAYSLIPHLCNGSVSIPLSPTCLYLVE